jgi:predicted RNase H-like HicB family nuclease
MRNFRIGGDANGPGASGRPGRNCCGMMKEMSKTSSVSKFALAIEYYREEDGRWLADIAALPGVTAYGRSKRQATAAVQALALRLMADRLEHGEALPGPLDVSFVAA